jgi:hypothetical protein
LKANRGLHPQLVDCQARHFAFFLASGKERAERELCPPAGVDGGDVSLQAWCCVTRPVARIVITFAVVAALALAVAVALTLGGRPPSAAPLPNPNGYDDLVKATALLVADSSDSGAKAETDLRALVATNAEGLKLARVGLGRESRVPLVFRPDLGGGIKDLGGMRQLALSFAAEGKLAELQDRPEDAAKSYLDAIHLGQQLTHGGLIIHGLVGIAMEAIGIVRLEKLLPALDARGCRATAQALEGLESERESPEAILAQERAWYQRAGLRERIAHWVNFKAERAVERSFVQKAKGEASRVRQLMLRLAARSYELDHQIAPGGFTNLVPTYLKAIPLDPFTGSNMVYRP